MAAQRGSGKRLGDLLLERRLVDPDDLAAAIAEQLRIPCLRSQDLVRPDPAALELLSAEQAARYRVLPLAVEGDRLEIAMADPLDLVARDEIERITGKKLQPVVCSEELLEKAIGASYLPKPPEDDDELSTAQPAETGDVDLDDLRVLVNDSPIVKLVNSLIVKAIRDGASDIHVEPQKKRLRVRYRIDGVLYPLASVARDLAPVVVSRIKILANMDIAERRLPQDGRFTVVLEKKEVDLRVSSLPGIFGEKIVLRILVKDAVRFDFDELGYSPWAQAILRRHVHRPQGLILLTGPTGSGKTTTLYTCLSEIDRDSLNVVTLEDPVEYQLPGIHQVHIHSKIGLTFAAGLRTILRQDPDVIMVGEIRDRETAEMAIRAALTGHLVLSTLHTNDAMGTISRLVNMGIEPFLVAEAVTLVGAQRLVRANCTCCLEPYRPDPSVLARFGLESEPGPFLRGRGCPQCRQVGYRGRLAVIELAEIGPELREAIVRGEPAARLRERAMLGGMKALREDGVEKARAGRTTLEEVLRVCAED
jgi:type II secretory ATPase GspE/PulE/Tfp pilus assembly ATPase PilB-like protein